MRGIIAEAVFENEVIPAVSALGWQSIDLTGDHAYDVLLRKDEISARIQIKLQRLEKGVPKLYYPKHYPGRSLYVVEVQKTRGGERSVPRNLPQDRRVSEIESNVIQTRPYRFGDFDILAVNMHPSTNDWKQFRYTLSSWLVPRLTDMKLIEIFQPVESGPSDVWTDSLPLCLEWLRADSKKRIFSESLHIRRQRTQ